MATSTKLILAVAAIVIACLIVFYATGPRGPAESEIPVAVTESEGSDKVAGRVETESPARSALDRSTAVPTRRSDARVPPRLSAERVTPIESPPAPAGQGGVLGEGVQRALADAESAAGEGTDQARPAQIPPGPARSAADDAPGDDSREQSAADDAGASSVVQAEPRTTDESTQRQPATEGPAVSRDRSTPVQYTPYVVRPGDSMTTIAEQWFGDPNKWDLIAKANPMVDPLAMRIGMELRLPPRDSVREPVSPTKVDGRIVYTVRGGDSLTKIAAAYYGSGKHWRIIYDANRTVLSDGPDHVRVGMKLVIPPAPAEVNAGEAGR